MQAGDGSDDEDAATSYADAETTPIPEIVAGDDNIDVAADDTERQVMAAGLPDLARVSRDLISLLRNAEGYASMLPGLLRLKEAPFIGIRGMYISPHETSPYFDWAAVSDLLDPYVPRGGVLAEHAGCLTNLATTLSGIARIELDAENVLGFFADIGQAFPTLLRLGENDGDLPLALDVRTRLAIEMFSIDKPENLDFRRVLAMAFCGVSTVKVQEYPKLFANGPFLPLRAGQDADDSEVDLISDRITKLLDLNSQKGGTKVEKKAALLERLEYTYPVMDTIIKLKDWTIAAYDTLESQGDSSLPQDANDEDQMSYDNPESQPESLPIHRATSETQQ